MFFFTLLTLSREMIYLQSVKGTLIGRKTGGNEKFLATATLIFFTTLTYRLISESAKPHQPNIILKEKM